MAFQAISTIIQMFSTSWMMFCILFFITGLGRVSSYVSAFVLGKCEYLISYLICSCPYKMWLKDYRCKWVLIFDCVSKVFYNIICYIFLCLCPGTEILTGKVRVMFSSLGVCVSFTTGYMLLPLFAYFLRDWKNLLFSISLPSLLYLPFWW